MYKRFITGILLGLMLLHSANVTAKVNNDNYHDYRAQYIAADLLKMQQFHLQQAQIKLENDQAANAWGDLAYLLCHIPNHHEVLQQMQTLALQLNKQEEMLKFYDKAINIFPDDAVAHALYGLYLTKLGDPTKAMHQKQLALELDPKLADKYYSKPQ